MNGGKAIICKCGKLLGYELPEYVTNSNQVSETMVCHSCYMKDTFKDYPHIMTKIISKEFKEEVESVNR
jgi:hypothetical protein